MQRACLPWRGRAACFSLTLRLGLLSLALVVFTHSTWAFIQPRRAPLPEIDLRIVPPEPPISETQKAAVAELRSRLPQVHVDFHSIIGSPALISARERFLSS